MKKLSRVYIAGLFDGEGTVGLYYEKRKGRGRGRWRASLAIDQKRDTRTDALLKTLAAAYGTRATYSGPDCRFQLHQIKGMKKFLKDITRHTIIKKAQLLVLGAWIECPSHTFRIHQTLKAMKRRA